MKVAFRKRKLGRNFTFDEVNPNKTHHSTFEDVTSPLRKQSPAKKSRDYQIEEELRKQIQMKED